jgi:hypothetical protein
MRVSVNQRGYTLSNLSSEELNTVMFLLGSLKDRCFKDGDYDKENDVYYDGGDFVSSLTPSERQGLHGFVDGFWHEYDKLKERIQKTTKNKGYEND